MAWNIIRQATQTEQRDIEIASWEFLHKHSGELFSKLNSDSSALSQELVSPSDIPQDVYTTLRGEWHEIARSVFDDPRAEGVINGNVGFFTDP